MANLGVMGPGHYVQAPIGRLVAPLIKKCAILAMSGRDDQCLCEIYDECGTSSRFETGLSIDPIPKRVYFVLVGKDRRSRSEAIVLVGWQ
ncbi:hypothetical protein PsyrCH409_00705 [Pseudomonas viridiflava]|nr:hypothetical protein PsyrCH409_00705 [Pseudomonas viridiflava]